MTRQSTHLQRLQAIASAYDNQLKTAHEALSDALEILLDELPCDRISLWRFEPCDGSRALRCLVAKRPGRMLTDEGALLLESQYREYFAALVTTGYFVSHDARADPKLLAMRRSYLEANNIGALLDVPLAINGRAFGLVCCEMLGGPHTWSAGQRKTARETVARAGLLLAANPSSGLDLLESVSFVPL